MNTAWKPMNGFEAVNAAEKADMEIEVNILDEWKPWSGEFDTLLAHVWFKDLKFRARQRNPTEAQTGENKVSEWHELNGIEEVAAASKEGMEIECKKVLGTDFQPWEGQDWFAGWQYRARHKAPAKVLVKRICWTSTGGNLTWTKEDYQFYSKDWKRFPAGDIEGEVDV
jgi:hypothetical protein